MKRIFFITALLAALFIFASASHKFYVAIHQVNYSQEKKMLQVTSRVFVDDLNDALKKKYNKKTDFGENLHSEEDIALLKKYFAENFIIRINGKQKPLDFLSTEIESNVLICYFRSPDISKINSIAITNKILFDFVTEQQNIIQTSVYGKKNNLLLTIDNPSGKLDY